MTPPHRLRNSHLVRHSTARVIAAIASIEVPLGNWPQLLPFLHQSVVSDVVTHREVGIYILFTVLENIVEGFQEHLHNFFKLFGALLADPESIDVRITTVRFVISSWSDCLFLIPLFRALGIIAQYIDGDDKADIVSCQCRILQFPVALIARNRNPSNNCCLS
jgi:hypothetical protein